MVICVTGQMAAGKNAVSSLFESAGWQSVDADKVVHEAIRKLTPRILAEFEAEAKSAKICLANSDGSLNRRALGELIFGKPELVARQEKIVYPEVIGAIKNFCGAKSDNSACGEIEAENKDNSVGTDRKNGENKIINATVLYKTPELMQLCDAIVFVTAPFFVRLRRALKRDKIPLMAILARFKSQRGLLQKYKEQQNNIYIVKNSSDICALEKKVSKIVASLV